MSQGRELTLAWLDASKPDQPFPDPEQALSVPNGLLAVGGDLQPVRLLRAYAQGIFPWFNPDEPVFWWCPNPRTALRVGQLHRSRSLRRAFARQEVAFSLNQAFAAVLEGCARPEHRGGTWLGESMQAAYTRLHHLGHAHSLEVWHRGALVGGIYGVAMGRIFYGESMFSRRDNASKLALWVLDDFLQRAGFAWLDGQVESPHLLRMGFGNIERREFLAQVRQLGQACHSPRVDWRLPPEQAGDARHFPRRV